MIKDNIIKVRVDEETKATLERLSMERYTSVSQLVREALRVWMSVQVAQHYQPIKPETQPES